MTSSTAAATFTGISTIAVPCTDQERAKAFYEGLGFETTRDAELGPGVRWIEVGATDGGTTLALVANGPELPVGIDTGIRLLTADARAAHAELTARGLDVGDLLDWPTAPLMFTFCDHDGNRLYVAEDS